MPPTPIPDVPMYLLTLVLGCSGFDARERARQEAVVADARVALGSARRSAIPGCPAVSVEFRTAAADLPRSQPGAPDVHALRTDDGRLIVRTLVRDGHGDANAWVYSEPPANRDVLAPLFDSCGLGEWERYDDLGDGWFGVWSGLD